MIPLVSLGKRCFGDIPMPRLLWAMVRSWVRLGQMWQGKILAQLQLRCVFLVQCLPLRYPIPILLEA